MKKLLFVMAILMMGSAAAEEVIVFDKSWYEIGQDVSVTQHFEVNEEMGRAWIEFSVTNSDPDSISQEFRSKVDGLTFDSTLSAVVFNYGGQVINCANITTRGRSVFRKRIVRPTGNCKFEGKWREVIYDDGYEMKKTYKYMIKMILN